MNAEDAFGWIGDPRLQAVFAALNAEGEARLVGGCVRDSLLGQDPLRNAAIDIDIATDRTPEEMARAFDAAGIRWIATGEAHGTLTAVTGGLVAECTTLRADEETDGRHAKVRFTRDWDEDWRRRDFTINALYTDHEGQLFDPGGGLRDLRAGQVRFIGDAEERIREDALRILRFFRFSARFAERFDACALTAIGNQTELLTRLSKERIWSELNRLFEAKRAAEALMVAAEIGVLAELVPHPARPFVFGRLPAGASRAGALGLAALWPDLDRAALRRAFKPSAETLDGYEAITAARTAIATGMAAHELLYRFGRSHAQAGLCLAAAEGLTVDAGEQEAVARGRVPELPVSGKDFVARGVPPGPEVGAAVKRFERLWLDEGSPTDEAGVERLLGAASGGEAPR